MVLGFLTLTLKAGRGGARTPLDHCLGTLEQGTKPTNAHIRPCDALGTHPGVDPALTLVITLPITRKVKSSYEDK